MSFSNSRRFGALDGLLRKSFISCGSVMPFKRVETRQEKKTDRLLITRLDMNAARAVQCTELRPVRERAVIAICATIAPY